MVNRRDFDLIINLFFRENKINTTKFNFSHFDMIRKVGLEGKSVMEYGIKWHDGIIMLRHYLDDNLAEIIIRVGFNFDSIELSFNEENKDNFISLYKTQIIMLLNKMSNIF